MFLCKQNYQTESLKTAHFPPTLKFYEKEKFPHTCFYLPKEKDLCSRLFTKVKIKLPKKAIKTQLSPSFLSFFFFEKLES